MAFKISIVVPILNEEKHLPILLKSIADQNISKEMKGFVYEIIVVDHESTDNSEKICRNFKNLRYLKSKEGGISYQRNHGADNVKGDIICFFDADIQIPSDFFQTIFLFYQKHDRKKYVTYPATFPTGKNIFLYFLFSVQTAFFFCIQWFRPIMSGPCMVIPTSIWKKSGGFSHSVHFEDVEFSRRLGFISKIRMLPTFIWFSPRRFYTNGFIQTTILYIVTTFSALFGYHFSKKSLQSFRYTFGRHTI